MPTPKPENPKAQGPTPEDSSAQRQRPVLLAGSRVKERPNPPGGHVAALPYLSQPRRGEIIAISEIKSKGRTNRYALVLWDGHKSASRHAIGRLMPES